MVRKVWNFPNHTNADAWRETLSEINVLPVFITESDSGKEATLLQFLDNSTTNLQISAGRNLKSPKDKYQKPRLSKGT